jgi:hypothetical protein
MSVATLGCLYPDPPEYHQAERTPPVLSAPLPPVTSILAVNTGDLVHINVGLRSEDAGERLMGLLYLNYQVPGRDQSEVGSTFVSAGTFEELRTVAIDWVVPQRTSAGSCEQLTLLITHVSNLNNDKEPDDYEDVAVITWWVSINDSQLPISDCPGALAGTS